MKKLTEDVYVSTEYPGVNVGFIVQPRGAIAIDAPTLPGDAEKWRQRVIGTAGGPILYVVLTDTHPDRLFSAWRLGAPIVAARPAYDEALEYTAGFWRSAIDMWTRRYPEAAEELSREAIQLPQIMFSKSVILRKGGSDVRVERADGNAPGSAWIYLRDRELLFTGDTLTVDAHPVMGATPDTKAWMDTLTTLRRPRYEGVTLIPGRGPVGDQSDTRPLSDYLALIRRRVRSLLRGEVTRSDKAAVVSELMEVFPVDEADKDFIQRRVKASLDRALEELETE